ncbi:helicase associated domain-containing protein [Streptomyces sp. NPDC055808]
MSCAKSAGAGVGGGAGNPSGRAAFQRLASSSFQPFGRGHGTPQAASPEETHRTNRRRGPERKHKLGAWISNQRSRAVALTPDRTEQLSAIGMRWV